MKGRQLDKTKKFILDLSIRFRDIDPKSHVNNAVYFTYFENGRIEFFKQVFGMVNIKNIDIIVAHIRCDYLTPIRLMDKISLHQWVSNISRKSFEFRYDLVSRTDTGFKYAKGTSVQVFYDYAKNSSGIIPDHYRHQLEEYLIKTEESRWAG